MSVIPFTLFFSLLLAGTFIVLFAREQRRHFGGAERDSLLPLADETLRPVAKPVEHAAHKSCGCSRGTRPPCAGCLRRRAEEDPTHIYF